jgi:hypothetical protein
MPVEQSLNTILLQIFRRLADAGRSFSAGDLACDEVSLRAALGTAHAQQCEDGEHALRTPLAGQCPCDACVAHALPKRAVEIVSAGGCYKRLRLKPLSCATLEGMMEHMRTRMGYAAHAVPGCRNRSGEKKPYRFAAHDLETYALVCDDLDAAVRELEQYNKHRTGDEFFTPSELLLPSSAFIV